MTRGGLSAIVLGLVAACWGLSASPIFRRPAPFADAADLALVRRGKGVYADNCASCHGRNLQGQPLWQLRDLYAGRRAPAQDAAGHSWQHSDTELFHKIVTGRFSGVPVGSASFMPAFQDRLAPDDVLAAMAFIKARWPLAMRASQAMLNPGQAGMPAGAARAEWRVPPTCIALVPP